ncbi:MAG: DNA polymerase III subunit beta [Leptolyngbya sp. PLA3]|nr:MAG: DNA polymerase III subunit beta [Cyanobacteria bacterium CYA]MCE7967710.1 DNA polymerase III subunit beta [Leptolyngbya sp. PL-A3]
MKVICDRAALLDALTLVSGVVNIRSPRPQLSCVLFEAESDSGAGELSLTATDAEISLVVRIGRVDVEQPGKALILADKILQIIRAEENDPTLTISTEKDLCHITGSDAHFQLHGYDPKDYPPIPDFNRIAKGSAGQAPARTIFSHRSGSLIGLITRTSFATARENSRYAINGVLFKRDGKRLELVATDGRRLALARDSVSESVEGGPVSCIIPTKALSLLVKLAEDQDEPINVAITENQAVFAFGPLDDQSRAVLTTNLVEGTFPPYEDVIPKDHEIKVGFDRDVFASAVRRAALLTNEESRGVRMAFKGTDKQVELSSRAPEMGEARVTVDLASFEGDSIEIGFNPAFITDALKVIDQPEVLMELKGPNKPGLFRSGADFLYVVMPVTLS